MPDAPQPVCLSDSQIATVMSLARPLLPDQRTAFLKMIAAKLRGCNGGDVGDGVIYRLCLELQREMLVHHWRRTTAQSSMSASTAADLT